MGYLVYILRCGDGTLYTGCTNDLPRFLPHKGAGDRFRLRRFLG